MGASGAGKTSLLNRIASRIKSSKGQTMTGEVKLNDKHVLDAKLFAKYSTYVM